MRIALTGSTGLIGSAMLRRLGEHHEIVTVGRRSSSDIRLDLSDSEATSDLNIGQVDALVHCAGVIDEDFKEDPERAFRTAVFGADALVKAALAAGASRLVYISSAHVYGPMIGRVDESSPPNPASNYAIAHFATEQVFRRYSNEDIAAVALRPCAVFGELVDISSFRRWSLIPFSFPRDAVLKNQIVINSTGEQRRNFVGTADVADCCLHWLEGNPSGWSTLNPRGELDASVYEFAQLCATVAQELSGKSCEISRQAISGPTVGDDFDYASSAEITQGGQSTRDTLKRLMVAFQQER